jgi:predicted component of type VI protein secretion system
MDSLVTETHKLLSKLHPLLHPAFHGFHPQGEEKEKLTNLVRFYKRHGSCGNFH